MKLVVNNPRFAYLKPAIELGVTTLWFVAMRVCVQVNLRCCGVLMCVCMQVNL